MLRETTIEAFHKVRATGMLSSLRLKVFEILSYHGPMTANEMRQYGDADANSGVYSTRLSELERMGVVHTLGKRPCKTTGHNALIWDVSGFMPRKLDKSPYKNKADIKKKALALIEELDIRIDLRQRARIKELYGIIKEI